MAIGYREFASREAYEAHYSDPRKYAAEIPMMDAYVREAEKERRMQEPIGAMCNAPRVRRFRHKKRRTTYELLGRAKLQIAGQIFNENQIALLSENLREKLEKISCVVYRSEADDTLWVRPEAEFFDGRFEEIT